MRCGSTYLSREEGKHSRTSSNIHDRLACRTQNVNPNPSVSSRTRRAHPLRSRITSPLPPALISPFGWTYLGTPSLRSPRLRSFIPANEQYRRVGASVPRFVRAHTPVERTCTRSSSAYPKACLPGSEASCSTQSTDLSKVTSVRCHFEQGVAGHLGRQREPSSTDRRRHLTLRALG